ncbi:hypothetical protein NQ318_022867 [Aromia moschata]|uniref:Uncharacterized protein n=1 Tax=Aromia moschata TaxID=1265417 RepID=A0AAV8XIB9_9CUCU|nr:hypothetical protein NQ318_022867 [Aromia moschata]
MRILEGMRNAGNAIPKKVHRTNRGSPNQAPIPVLHAAIHQQQGTTDHRINSNKQNSHLIPHQPYAKAMYDYMSKEAGCKFSYV